jgi:hypothetical protein
MVDPGDDLRTIMIADCLLDCIASQPKIVLKDVVHNPEVLIGVYGESEGLVWLIEQHPITRLQEGFDILETVDRFLVKHPASSR